MARKKGSEPPCQDDGEPANYNEEMDLDCRHLLRTTACKLQACLNKNTYTPEKCEQHVRKLYECCRAMYEETNGKGESTACPVPRVVERWLKDHPESIT